MKITTRRRSEVIDQLNEALLAKAAPCTIEMRRPHRLRDPRVGDWPPTLNDGRRPSGPQKVDGSAGDRRAASHCGVRSSKRAAPIPGVPAGWCGATLPGSQAAAPSVLAA
jgi:hypothetical protein